MLHQDSFHQQNNFILLGGNFIRVKLSVYVFYLYSSRKCSYPPHESSMENSKGRRVGGSAKDFFKESIKVNWNFQRCWGGRGGLEPKCLTWWGNDKCYYYSAVSVSTVLSKVVE